MCSRNNDLSEEKKRMRIIISGGRNRGVSLHNNYSEGRDLWCAADHPTIFRFFFLSLSIQLCKKKKKHCLPSLDHTTPLSPLPFSLSARPLLPSECSRLMHPPLFSLLFFFLLLSQSSLVFFPPQSASVASSFNHGLWNKRGYGRQQWTHFIRRRKECMDKKNAFNCFIGKVRMLHLFIILTEVTRSELCIIIF